MHGTHKDTHIEFTIYECSRCGRTGFDDAFKSTWDLLSSADCNWILQCPFCGCKEIKELGDES